MQHEGPDMGDLQKDAEKERRGGERCKTARTIGHTDNSGEKKMKEEKVRKQKWWFIVVEINQQSFPAP